MKNFKKQKMELLKFFKGFFTVSKEPKFLSNQFSNPARKPRKKIGSNRRIRRNIEN